jgi:hypothetical protein
VKRTSRCTTAPAAISTGPIAENGSETSTFNVALARPLLEMVIVLVFVSPTLTPPYSPSRVQPQAEQADRWTS